LSKGNYFRDTDGNTILDLDCPLTLGYNNDEMINARDSPMFDRFLQGRVNASNVAPHDYADILRESVMPVAPSGMA
jgi:4-aminobutyrate aminotransferase/(S)-3-amino-2-methylpropionate transaminase